MSFTISLNRLIKKEKPENLIIKIIPLLVLNVSSSKGNSINIFKATNVDIRIFPRRADFFNVLE